MSSTDNNTTKQPEDQHDSTQYNGGDSIAKAASGLGITGGRRRRRSNRISGVRKSIFRRKRRGSRRNCSSKKGNLFGFY